LEVKAEKVKSEPAEENKDVTEVMQILAEVHFETNSVYDEMLKVPKKRMPLLIFANKLAKVMQSASSGSKTIHFRQLAAATCMP
jgi:hypothetical protein